MPARGPLSSKTSHEDRGVQEDLQPCQDLSNVATRARFLCGQGIKHRFLKKIFIVVKSQAMLVNLTYSARMATPMRTAVDYPFMRQA